MKSGLTIFFSFDAIKHILLTDATYGTGNKGHY